MNQKTSIIVAIAMHWRQRPGDVKPDASACAAAEVPHVDAPVAPPFTAIAIGTVRQVAGHRRRTNVHGKPHGAFTGEISAGMLNEAGALGHRRLS